MDSYGVFRVDLKRFTIDEDMSQVTNNQKEKEHELFCFYTTPTLMKSQPPKKEGNGDAIGLFHNH